MVCAPLLHRLELPIALRTGICDHIALSLNNMLPEVSHDIASES
jgi:hypothetical protein